MSPHFPTIYPFLIIRPFVSPLNLVGPFILYPGSLPNELRIEILLVLLLMSLRKDYVIINPKSLALNICLIKVVGGKGIHLEVFGEGDLQMVSAITFQYTYCWLGNYNLIFKYNK